MLTLHDSMKLQYKQGDNLIFIDRPSGFLNRGLSQNQPGLAELYAEQLGHKKLWPLFDCDIKTTGAMLLLNSEQQRSEILAQNKSGSLRQKFWFLTAQKSNEMEFRPTPSATIFKRIKRSPFFELWEVESPLDDGKSIRAQAASLGLAILGDLENGGAPFFHLCFHSLEISMVNSGFFAPPPRIFERLGVLRDPVLCQWLMSVDSRQRLFNFLQHPEQTLRLSHSEQIDLRWEALGPVLWGAWYQPQDPTPVDLQRFDFLATVLNKKFRVRKMLDRGKDPLSRIDWTGRNDLSEQAPDAWVAYEGPMKFQFDSRRGLSHGLFLDQRNNREYVLTQSRGKRVLNLFAYTCGFSLAAALGGATEVASVDVSREFLDWGKENFALNNLDPEKYEFFKQDSLLFLKGAAKRQRAFDLIVCDPPSFARNRDSLFSLERNLEDLLLLCLQVLSPQGELMFSCNLEKWTQADLEKRIQKMSRFRLKLGPQPTLDYEKPQQNRLLKSVLLAQKS